jgi:hypothetical protein
MHSITRFVTAVVVLYIARLVQAMPDQIPTQALAMSIRHSTTFQHGLSVTSCPCYEPSRPDCGIKAFTYTTAIPTGCPVPTNCGGGVPKCIGARYTLYRDRCPQQVYTTVVVETCHKCLRYCSGPLTTTLAGVGPVEL